MSSIKSVSLELRSAFELEIKNFGKELRSFIDGSGEMPKTNTEKIKENYIKLGSNELVKHGNTRFFGNRVSKHTFDALLAHMVK